MSTLSSKDIIEKVSDSAIPKSNSSAGKLFVLAILAGAYIAFGAQGATMASFNLIANPDTLGIGRFVTGAIFPVGLMLVVLCGAELFTGNCLMVVGVADKKTKFVEMLRNWAIVYIGNLVGSLLIVLLMSQTGLWDMGGGLLGAVVVKIAAGKTSLTFIKAFCLGIMCNWLVCLAIYMATGAKEMISKMAAIWVAIMMFVMSGFEHSIANMYYIPAGIVASHMNPEYASILGIDVSNLTISGFLVSNLLPVTLGNIVGGCIFVGMTYWLIHKKL